MSGQNGARDVRGMIDHPPVPVGGARRTPAFG